jgi:hypothetical protein
VLLSAFICVNLRLTSPNSLSASPYSSAAKSSDPDYPAPAAGALDHGSAFDFAEFVAELEIKPGQLLQAHAYLAPFRFPRRAFALVSFAPCIDCEEDF